MNIEKIIETFDKYTKNYDMNDDNILLKNNHSYRVMDLCGRIGQSLNFNDSDIDLALVIGLLHDYARFKQWTMYKTYNDAKSIDHANLAVKMLFDDNQIKDFGIPTEYYETIFEAIKNHNKLDYPRNISKRDLIFCKLIKDADKLDIFYLISTGKIKLFNDNSNISKIINNDFFENRLSNKQYIQTNNDRIIFYLNMMYDLNFDYSYEFIRDKNLIQEIFNLMNLKENVEQYFNYMNEYVEERSKQYVRKKI